MNVAVRLPTCATWRARDGTPATGGTEQPRPRRYRPCSSMTLTAVTPRDRPLRAGRHRVWDRPERQARPL